MINLSKVENTQHQLISKEMLNQSLNAAADADSALSKKMPSFTQKIDSMEVVATENCPVEIKENLLKELSKIKDGENYEILLSVKDEDDTVYIISQKEGDAISAAFIIAISDDGWELQ